MDKVLFWSWIVSQIRIVVDWVQGFGGPPRMPTLPFQTLQKLDLPMTELVSGRLDYVHDAFLPFRYEVCESLPDDDQDLVVLVGKRRRSDCIRRLDEYPGRSVVVFAPGDASVRAIHLDGRQSLPSNVVAAFATNNELADRRAISVPLGVRPGNLRTLQFVKQNHSGRRSGLLYGNFALNDDHYRPERSGAPHVRARLVDALRDAPWAKMEISTDHRLERADLVKYYAQIATHKFVLSPPGNGIDCYRTWEALYLGAIPVVRVSTSMSAFAALPILFTDDYSELSEVYLEERWREMSSRSFEIERILKSWYMNRFLNAVSVLDQPRFICWHVDESPYGRFIHSLKRSSRSVSNVVAETPVPPYTEHGDLMQAEAWHTPGDFRLEQLKNGLRAIADGDDHAVAEIALHTIAGASFRLTGTLRVENGSGADLSVDVASRPHVVAVADVGGRSGSELELDFVARSDRAVLSVRAPGNSAGTTWLLSDLTLQAVL
jgi:hypothetical protein